MNRDHNTSSEVRELPFLALTPLVCGAVVGPPRPGRQTRVVAIYETGPQRLLTWLQRTTFSDGRDDQYSCVGHTLCFRAKPLSEVAKRLTQLLAQDKHAKLVEGRDLIAMDRAVREGQGFLPFPSE